MPWVLAKLVARAASEEATAATSTIATSLAGSIMARGAIQAAPRIPIRIA